MERMLEHVRGVLRTVLVCGMVVQILLGLTWMIVNIGGLQTFQESMVLLTGKGDLSGLYSGVLYRYLAGLFSSHLWILYGLQLAAALGAAYALLSVLMQEEFVGLRVLGALALMTIPQAMQCHLAVLPWSLGTSLMMGETALWLKLSNFSPLSGEKSSILTNGAGKAVVEMLLNFCLILLILPVYAWFMLPLLFAALWRLGKGKRGPSVFTATASGERAGIREQTGKRPGRGWILLPALLLILFTVTVNCGWRFPDWDRRLATSALSRTGWPYFQDNYEIFPEDLHEAIGLVTAREVSAYADGVERVLIPKLESIYGEQETTDILWKLTGICLKENLKTDIKNVVWDMAAYHATPPILAMQLRGRAYDSYSGINYEQMRTQAPLLTGYYVTYGGRWWWIMLSLAAVMGISEWWLGRSRRKKGITVKQSGQWKKSSGYRELVWRWLPVGIGAEWMILNYTFSGSGIMDYKKTLWVIIFWYLAVMYQLTDRKGRVE